MWFVDKLGPAPGAAQPATRANGAAKTQAQPAAQRPQPAQAKAAPAPEPEKKKKKGWF
jgi:hypothetical protein